MSEALQGIPGWEATVQGSIQEAEGGLVRSRHSAPGVHRTLIEHPDMSGAVPGAGHIQGMRPSPTFLVLMVVKEDE